MMLNRSASRVSFARNLALLGLVACTGTLGDGVDFDSGSLSDAPVADGQTPADSDVLVDVGPFGDAGPVFDGGVFTDTMDAGDSIAEIRVTPDVNTLSRGDELSLTARAFNGRGEEVVVAFSWSSSDSSVASVDPSGRAIGVGTGTGTIRASAGGAVGTATVDVEPLDAFTKNYIEALFLGTGPFIPADGATECVTFPGRWAAYPRGTTVTIVASTTLDNGSDGVDTVALLRAALANVEVATLGAVRVVLTTTTDPDPIPGPDQATVTDHPDPISTGCPFDRGCVHSEFRDAAFTVIESNRIVLRESILPADAYVHDTIGHGVMGMCHIDQAAIGGTPLSLMSGGPGAFSGDIADGLSPLDIAAARAVYATSLEPGARRADFVALGLINPES